MNVKELVPHDYILETSKEYSIYVAENRSIPKVSDGLKDGQRKALWLLRNSGDKHKTIGLSGHLLSSGLYLHGDASASATISNLAAPFQNNVTLIEGIGSFGTKVKPYDIGAPRYTSVKRSKNAQSLLYHDLNIVPLKDNYDGSTKEPITFLPVVPLVLLNGVNGIAVGWSTSILPRRLEDIKKATLAAIEGKKIPVLQPCYEYLDTTVKHVEGNTWEFFGKLKFEDKNSVRITELPPDLSLEKFKDRLDSYEDDGKIQSYDDYSTKAINILVKFKRGGLNEFANEQELIDFFKLKSRKTERIVVIDWNYESIREYETAEKVVEDFVQWRFGHYVTRYETLKSDRNTELNYYLGVKACFDKGLPNKLSTFENKAAVVEAIRDMTKDLTNDQVESIASFASYRWAKDNYQTVLNKIAELQSEIKLYESYLGDHSKIWNIFKDEVKGIKV